MSNHIALPIHYMPSGFTRVTNRCYAHAQLDDLNRNMRPDISDLPGRPHSAPRRENSAKPAVPVDPPLRNVPLVFAMIRDGLIALAFDCQDHLPQLAALASRYGDRHPDLADLCLIRMSELFPRHSVITVDREDFRVYRRNKREAIPLICPPHA